MALSKTENGAALFTRMQVVEDVTSKTLQQVVDKAAAPGAKIECDGYRSYKNLSGVELDAKKYESGDLHWLHKAISNLKAFLMDKDAGGPEEKMAGYYYGVVKRE